MSGAYDSEPVTLDQRASCSSKIKTIKNLRLCHFELLASAFSHPLEAITI